MFPTDKTDEYESRIKAKRAVPRQIIEEGLQEMPLDATKKVYKALEDYGPQQLDFSNDVKPYAIESEEQKSSRMPVLEERGKRYGDFKEHAYITQDLKRAMRYGKNWLDMEPDQKEALEMIQHKIGRILNGDPNYADSWVDIAGYATLVAERLEKKEQK